MVLAGDIGGTNVRLALFEAQGKTLKNIALEVFRGRDYPGLAEVLLAFLEKHHAQVSSACIGVAGVPRDGMVEMTNLKWKVDPRQVASMAGLASLRVINDLEANAYGLEALGPEDLATLNAGKEDPVGNRCMASAGTGLGEAGLIWTGDGFVPFHSEGGHSDYAPTNEAEIALLRYLMARHPNVSYERVVSGPGLRNIYDFLRDTGQAEEPAWLAERLQVEGTPVITALGLTGEAELCVKALDFFATAYGRVAGNLALQVMATAGVYLGGGIAPNIVPKLRSKTFLEAFLAKGRLRPWLERMPVRVIMNDKTALLGAAWVAAFHK